jgi:hypothetical protein
MPIIRVTKKNGDKEIQQNPTLVPAKHLKAISELNKRKSITEKV